MKSKGHRCIESTSVHRQTRQRVDTHTHTRMHPASEPLAVLLQSVWSSVSREATGLWQCFTHSNTHWLGGKDGLQREKASRRDSRSNAPPQSSNTHTSFSHPYLWITHCCLCRRRWGSAGEQAEVAYSHDFYFCFFCLFLYAHAYF